MQCTAKSKRSGQQCGNNAMYGQTVCRMHGGKSQRGIQAVAFSTGRYSKHIPGRLLDRYETAKKDPELLALRDEIGLLDARITDLLDRVDTGESGDIWKFLKDCMKDFNTAKKLGDTDQMGISLDNMFLTIERGQGDYAAWSEVQTAIEQRRRLVESERKRLIEMQQVVTAERATVLVYRILDILKRNVDDRGVLIKVGREMQGLLNAPESPSETAEVMNAFKAMREEVE